ncbi:hypothetical protein CO057_04270 [Candidatus Uhrbacteria bacterium CG_4_9_14_0_2_um_filter_41_50]|uniref:VanZ-like domain-containing protein n=1 Tax=Candidatus Uhrbacteria bacterium CG_4_9_14_0_2_um_filter_41_50 TaxID=1975031 RepID=A0A2M8EN62_9BACT|nr:MAG: hypothetical protein COZ45_04025 [Candidatus Uhrbacteria bacterium CG_4_10_14_3_um_filter_41_21]PIZ54346.1 MAG: hypothetical protein COY24_04105 [Candidatus Uhrbacteria bacterium CG_4_10_14_0_2_um_filter_41_21]PJB84678.1 MAG: hypothetical protein CO086_02505 [Candidatus Uhrbacteria bacterium CG_4_9_14_0_8_um_filter_41_16]PJC24168.1 MAG: hypothetical protein CO057_04270 [Candidatus Uhrbacteria bacterium CG_4_9_14_0_2_um_filter_41_50]PJE75083.1 MAG: hypothetical protein COV03_02020 [Candi
MNIKKAILLIITVLLFHALGLVWGYEMFDWYDIPMHIGGGLAMGALGLAIWNEGIEDIKFKGSLKKHIKWWLIPFVVLGFVSFIGILWELHEYIFDQLFPIQIGDFTSWRQPDLTDTMMDLLNDLIGGVASLIIWKNK